MSKKLDLSKINWLQIIGTVITIAGFFLGGGFVYNEVWKSKVLTYTVLPTYDVGGQVFSGLVIENRGRVPLTDVQTILTDLEAPIESLKMPGPHEPAQKVSGGEGQTELLIKMPRLSSGAPPLSIYILTSDTVKLDVGKTFFVSSKEVSGISSEQEISRRLLIIGSPVIIVMILLLLAGLWLRQKAEQLLEEAQAHSEEIGQKLEDLRLSLERGKLLTEIEGQLKVIEGQLEETGEID